MNKLIIKTVYPSTVAKILKTEQLIEDCMPHLPHVGEVEDLYVYYPDDAISQALSYWLTMACGCGLISGHEFIESWRQIVTD